MIINCTCFVFAWIAAAKGTTGLMRLLLLALTTGCFAWYVGVKIVGPQFMPPSAEVSHEAQ